MPNVFINQHYWSNCISCNIVYYFQEIAKISNEPIGILVVLNLFLAWSLFILIGVKRVEAANGIAWVVQSAHAGTGFAFASLTNVKMMDMAVAALFPILLIMPLFDILMYFNILPNYWRYWLVTKVTRQPKFESSFGSRNDVLGSTEALAVSSEQLKRMNEMRVLTIAMMSMSSVIGSYCRRDMYKWYQENW